VEEGVQTEVGKDRKGEKRKGAKMEFVEDVEMKDGS